MNKTMGLIKYHFLVLLREPITMFLAVALPFILLILQQGAMGEMLPGGIQVIDLAIPTFIVMTAMTLGILDSGFSHAHARQTKFLRRLRMTPAGPISYLFAGIVARLAVFTLFVIIFLAVTSVGFNATLAGRNWLIFTGALLLVFSLFYTIGMFFANLLRTGKAAQSIINAAYFALIFLGGIFIPLAAMPEFAQRITRHFPTAYAINLLEAAWGGSSLFYGHYLIVVIGITVVFGVLSVRFFKYE